MNRVDLFGGRVMFLRCRLKFPQVKNPNDSIGVGFVLYQFILYKEG